MNKRTIIQIINRIKAGDPITAIEARETILALSSLYIQSQMTVEAIANNINSIKDRDMYIMTKVLLGDLDQVRALKEHYLNISPSTCLEEQTITDRERIAFYDALNSEESAIV